MASWWEDYKKRKGLSSGGSDSQAGKTYNERMTTDEHRQAAKSSTWWEDYKKKNDLERKAAADRQRAAYMEKKRALDQQSYTQYTAAQRQLEKNRSRDAAEDEIRELFRNPFLSDAEWQARDLERAASRYGRDFPLYQEMLKSSAYSPALYNRSYSQATGAYNDLIAKRDSYTTAMKKAEQDRNESNLVNHPALYASEHMTPEQISAELDRLRSGAATPTVTDKDRNDPVYAYLYPEAALQKDPHGARFDERLVEDAGQDAIEAAYRPILTEQEKAAVEEADRKIIEDKANRNYERVQILKAAQSMQTERTSRETGNQLMEEIANGGEAANKAKTGKALFEQQQQQIASETSFEIGDDLDSNRGAYNKMQKERRERGYIMGYDWDNVPEARKQAVYALYAQDPKKAMELAKYYIADARQAEDEERQAWYAQSGWTAALGLVSSAAAHLGAAVDPFGDVGQELTRRGDNALAGGSQWADAATDYKKIPEWVPIVGGKGAGDFYQTVGSVVQSAAVAAPAILAGRYDKAAAEIISNLGLALMGSSAAASDYRESVAAGMDEDRAKLHALAAGVEEALFEEVSLDKLIKMDTSGGLKAALKNWMVQSGIEGSEELATSIANRITDEMISGAGQSKVERRASELIANGMNSTQAHTQAENEWMTDTLYEGFSGFLSGGMMTGGDYALQGLANLEERAVSAAETRKVQKQAGVAVSRSEGSVEALQAYAKDKGIEIKAVETAAQNAEESAEQGGQEARQNSYSSRDYRSISETNSKVTQSIRNDLRGKTVQEQQAVRDSLVEKYGDGIAPVVNNAISIETAARVRQEYGDVDSIQAARSQAVKEIKDESLRRAVSDGYDSAAYSLAASQGGEGGMNTMSRYIQQRNNTGTGEMSMNATVAAQDGSTKTIAITGMSEDGKRVSLADGSEVAVKDLQADADTTSAIQQLADLDLGADATKVLQAYQQSGVAGTEGYRWLMDYATAYNQGRTRQISLEQAAQRSSLDERTVMDAYTLGQQAANRETLAGLEKLKNLPKRKGANGRTANIDTTEIKGKTMSKSELEQFELANQYAQALGVDMKWFSSKEKDGKFVGKNGAYENGKIYMDIHAGRNFAADLTSGILATMGHELSHFEQQYAPEEYQALKEFLFEQIVKSSPNGEARLERLIWEKQKRSGYTLSRKAAEDEVVADACQKMLRDSKAVHDFASQQPEAANGVVRWLDKWFKKVRSIFGRGGNYSEEAKLMDSLEQDVKAAFGELWDKALKQAVQVHDEVGNIEGNADQYSLRDVDPVEPSSDAWSRSATFAEVKAKHPTLFALDADESDTRNPTQVKVTVSTYRKIYNMLKAEGFNGTILDASSGLGLGTETGRKEFGFDVDDIEPFPDKSYKPMYTDYSTLDKTYDVVISNAVLNVIPQDLRDAMVVKIGEMLKPGGRAFINVRGDDVLNAGSKVAINEDGMEYFISNTGSYQKGFTRNELKAYLEDALGDGFTVKIRKDFGKVSAEVIRDGSKAQNSDRDTEYLELAKDPEKNKARLQEMADKAAKRAGYTIKAWHGTPIKGFTSFDSRKIGSTTDNGLYGRGFYFSTNKVTADHYATAEGETMPVYLNAQNPWWTVAYKDKAKVAEMLDMDENALSIARSGISSKVVVPSGSQTAQFTSHLVDHGYDSIIIQHGSGNYEIVVFNSEKIKSADPVTYDDQGNVIPLSERFNEANEDIRYSERDELASDNQVHDLTNRSGETVGVQDGNGHLQFSQRTWRESGKEKMKEYLDERVRKYEANRNDPEGMHPDDAKALMDAVQEQYDALDEIVRQQPGNYKTYEEWADAEVETDIFGNPVFSWLKANGDYGISGDASLICVKRRTLDAVFDYMIRENMIQDGPEGLKLAQESIVAINDIIRAHGFETACSTCYIDARRYRAAIVAGSFCNVYNKLVRSMLKGKTGVPINAFNFGGNKSVTPLANSLDTLSNSEINWDGINKAIRDQEAKWESKGWEKFTEDGEEKWRRNGTVKNLPTSGTTEYRIALALKEKPSLRKLALRSDFLSGNGFLELNRTNKDILTLYNVKKGQAGPKATETDIQYLHEALENSFITPDRMFKAGGFRLQSFSDYVPRLVFDYVEIIGDLAAKGVPAHMYTKEILCVLQHGLTGTKINMSLIPAMVKKGIAPGLDADGNYLWRDGQTFGSTAYSLSPKLEAHLSKILGYQVKGRLTGAQGFELAKLIQNDPAYGKNNGTIAIGVSEAQIRKMLDDADIRMVIPYHKSGLNHILASMMEIPGFENYESYQNTLKWNGTKWAKVDVDFDFNEAVQKHKGDARAAAQDYLDWCEENEYKPKFSGVASGSARNSYNKAYDFTQHADWQTGAMTGEAESNYYKVLADFTCYDADGKVSRQEAVKLNYPSTDSAFGSMKQLIEMGLESDAMLQAKQDAEVPKIVDDIRREIPKFEAAGRNMKAYAQLKENVEGRQYSERDYFDGMSEEQVQEELAKLQQEKATAREKQRSLEKTDEYKRLFQDVLDKRSPEAISAFNKWADESGYVAAMDRAKEVDARRSEGAKVLDRLIDQRLEREEREAIQKSGKSEAEYFASQAVKDFGYTPYFYDAGYIVPNGKMLNFSGQKGRHFGSRGQDHRAIGQIYAATKGSAAMNRFMNQGNVRIMAESPGIDISNATPLTKEQYATIRRFVNEARSDEYFNLDFSDERGNNLGSIEYEGRFTADRVLNDIRHFFETGEVRQPSGLSAFYSERDYSAPSDEELLMGAKVEDADNADQGRLLKDYQALGKRIATLEKQLAEAKRQTQLTNRALNTRGIGNVVKTVMKDYDITDARHNGTAKNATLALTDGYQKALDLLDKGASPAEVNDAVYNGAVKAAEIILEQGTYSQNLGGKWQVYSASRYLGENSQELIDSFVSEAYADFVSNRYREARPETAADRLVARTKKEAQERVDKYKGRSDALAEANRRLEEKTTQAETEAKEARKAAGELFLEIKDLRQELMDNKTMSEQERKAASKKLKSLNKSLEAKREEAASWQKRAKRNASLLKSALESKNRDISALNNRLSKEQAAALEKQKSLEAKLEKQIQKYRDILAGKANSPELNKLLKAEREKAEARVKEQKEQVFQNYKERKKAGELRGRIKNLSDEMKRRMTNPTDRAYVPASLYQSMTKLADVLDNVLSPNPGTKAEARYRAMMDAIRGMAREYEDVKNLDPVFASEYEQEISDAIGEIERILERKNASWIDNLTGDTQKSFAELNSDELQQLYDLMRQINYTITNATKVFGNSNYKSIFDAQRAVAEQQNSMKSLNAVSRLERKKRLRLLNSLSVMRATEMMAGWDRSAALYQLMHGIEHGADDAWAWVMDYNKSMQDLKTGKNEKEYRQALTKQLDFGITDRDGLKVTMTKMQALQILMTAEREEHNDKLLHLQAGGAVIRNATDLQNGKGAKARSQTISVTPELIQKISDSLTEWDRAYMKTVRDYFKREGKRTNEILYKLKHKVLKTEEFYVPYTVDRNYLEANLNEQQALNMWVKTPGSTNALKQKAKQPVIIDGMDTVMGQHVKEIGNYIGMAIPIRDFSKVYNGMIPTEGPNPLPVKETIERTFGKAGQHLLTQAVIDVQGGTARQNWESNISQFLNKLQGAFVKSALLINPSVTIKQAASYIAAESVISHLALERGNHPVWARTDESKSFMPGGLIAQLFARPEGKTAQRIYNEIDQYTSLHYQRRQGMSMAEIAEQANRTGPIKRRINAIGASMEQSKIGHAVRRTGENLNPITWIQRMDVATTAALWVACKEQAKLEKLTVGSEEFWKRTTELYERCIRETQPMYDGLHRTANQKQAGGLMQYLFPFRTVPIQNHGQLAASYEAYKAARESKNEAKIKEAGKFFRKTAWAQTESAFVFSAMTFLAAILKRKTKKYRDEEGEFDAGSLTKGLLTDVGSTLISVLNPMYGSELFNLGSRAVDKFEGNSGYTYDAFSVGVVDMINDLASSGDRLLADAGKIVRGENVNAADFWNHALNLLLKGGKLAGIPADTVKTYFEGTKGNIQDAIDGRIPALNDESWERDAATNARRYLKAYLDNDTKKASAVLAELRSNLSKSGKGEEKINEAIRKYVSAQAVEKVADGTWTEEEAEAYLLSTGAYDDRENPQKDAWNAIRKGVAKSTSTDEEFNWKQYDDLAEAVANGEDVTDLLTEYRNHGYSDDQINAAIKSGIQEAMTAGDLDEEEAADALIRYGVTYSKNGKDVVYDEQAAWKKVQEWADKAEHTDEEGELEEGYKYSAYTDLFDAVDANQNADGVIQTMVQNGGYDTDSLRGKIKEHLLERFIAGQITETALKNQLSRYCKISKAEDANEVVANAKCKRDFGVYPDDLKEAFKDGDLSQNQAEKALQQYKGLSKTDAQNRVQYWGYDGDLSENAWAKWAHELKSTGLSVDNWEKVYKVKSSAKGTDANGDGRADSGTVKAEVVSYIDSMNIPKSQKKAIYLAFGWAASTMPNWR